MDAFDLSRTIIGVVAILAVVVFSFIKLFVKHNPITTKFITRTAIFSAIAIILYIVPYLKFPVPFFPAFLEIHFDEVPAFIAGFAYGPLSAFFIILVKTLVKLPLSSTMCVGELADFLYGVSFVIPAAFIYKKRRNFKSALLGLGISTLVQVTFASFFTTFVILNFYMFMMGLSRETILAMCQAINPGVTSLDWPFFFIVALPFNLFKDVIIVAITILLYKRLHRVIDKIGQ